MAKLVRVMICLGLAAAFALGASTIASADAGGPGVTAAASVR